MKVKLGADPELFGWDTDKKHFICAHGMIPGSKAKPHPVKKGAIQPDGFAFEFNIDPAESAEEFDDNIETVIGELKSYLPKNIELRSLPTAHFPLEYFKAQSVEARRLGCDPDYNAYTKEENPRPKTTKPMRTSGGHVHVGWRDGGDVDSDHIADCNEVVKQLDFYLGVSSIMWDQDYERRKLYGAPGACRYKPYGVEYRPLSSAWVLDSKTRQFIFNSTVGALKDLERGKAARIIIGNNWAQQHMMGVGYKFTNGMSDLYTRNLPSFQDGMLLYVQQQISPNMLAMQKKWIMECSESIGKLIGPEITRVKMGTKDIKDRNILVGEIVARNHAMWDIREVPPPMVPEPLDF